MSRISGDKANLPEPPNIGRTNVVSKGEAIIDALGARFCKKETPHPLESEARNED